MTTTIEDRRPDFDVFITQDIRLMAYAVMFVCSAFLIYSGGRKKNWDVLITGLLFLLVLISFVLQDMEVSR